MTQPLRFIHDTLLYASEGEFLATAMPFVEDGLEQGDPVLLATTSANLDLVAGELGARADQVDFAESAYFGRRTPQRVAEFHHYWQRRAADVAPGRHLRILAEPVWAGRSADEIVAWRRMESGLNVIFETVPIHMICPYDVRAVGPDIAGESLRTHPTQAVGRSSERAAGYVIPDRYAADCDAPLAEPPASAAALSWAGDLFALRRFTAEQALEHGLGEERADLFVLAVNEVATYLRGQDGSPATARLWSAAGAIVCDLSTTASLPADPYVGYYPPGTRRGLHAEGLWFARQVCDGVEIRPGPDGSRAQVRVPGPRAMDAIDSHFPYMA